MPIYKTAHFRVHPEALEKCVRAIQEFTEYVHKNEPGTRVYTSLQEEGNPASFMHYIIFENEEAHAIHGSSQGVKRFQEALYPELIEPVKFTSYTLAATR